MLLAQCRRCLIADSSGRTSVNRPQPVPNPGQKYESRVGDEVEVTRVIEMIGCAVWVSSYLQKMFPYYSTPQNGATEEARCNEVAVIWSVICPTI